MVKLPIKRIVKAIYTKPFSILKSICYNLFNQNQQLAEERLAICNKCDLRQFIFEDLAICGSCGCLLENKTRLKKEKCDLNKW